MAKHHVVEFDEACQSCRATGLCVGMGEGNGAAVVCHQCEGTGKHHVKLEYDDFTGRKDRRGVKRVYRVNLGIGIGEKAGVCSLPDFGGIPYKEWKGGAKFIAGTEDRQHTC